jgi:hypothetical protein
MNNGGDPEQNDPHKSVQVGAKLLASNHLRPLGYELRRGRAKSRPRRSRIFEVDLVAGLPDVDARVIDPLGTMTKQPIAQYGMVTVDWPRAADRSMPSGSCPERGRRSIGVVLER